MKKNKILIIDDENDFADIMKKRLEAFGYEVSSAFSGIEGLKKAEKNIPDLILLDIIMPHMDGFAVLSKLKDNAKTQDIPVVMLTGKDDIDSVLESAGLGMVDYVIKSFDTIDNLLVVIEKNLNNNA